MGKAVLLMVMLSGVASAVNLSQIKQEEVCLGTSNFSVYIMKDGIIKDSTRAAKDLLLAKMFTDAGFNLDDKCKYTIELYSEAINIFDIYSTASYLTLHAPTNLNKKNNVLVSNSYVVINNVQSISKIDVERRQYEVFSAMIQQFLDDWKQAHP